MKIEGYSNANYYSAANNQTNAETAAKIAEETARIQNEARRAAESAPVNTSNRQIMQDYAEYYFKSGKIYENVRSYRQALSAYERANIANPSMSVAESVLSVRKKIF